MNQTYILRQFIFPRVSEHKNRRIFYHVTADVWYFSATRAVRVGLRYV